MPAPTYQDPTMYKPNRIKLGEAPLIIAERLCGSNESDSNLSGNQAVARAQLIQALFDEELSSEGLQFYKDVRDVGEWPVPKEIDWLTIKSALWSNRSLDRQTGTAQRYKLDFIEVNWEKHSFTRIELVKNPAVFPNGFCEIRLLREDIERIWSPTTSDPTVSDQRYDTAWLRLMHEAIAHFKITEENQPLADILREWFSSKTADGQRVSAHLAKAMTTFVRLPKNMRGGNRPFHPVDRVLPPQG